MYFTLKSHCCKGGRARFLAAILVSSPCVMLVYTPLLAAQTVAGIAIPFATGHFIDAIVGGIPAIQPFIALATLSIASAGVGVLLQRYIMRHARAVEFRLQQQILDAAMGFTPQELSRLANGEIVAKLTRDAFAVGGFIGGLYPRLISAVVTLVAAGFALHSRSPILCVAFVAFIPLSIALFCPFARSMTKNSRSVRTRSDKSYVALFDFFRTLPFLRILDAERRFANSPRDSMHALNDGNRATDSLTMSFGALLGGLLVLGEVAVLGIAGSFAARGVIPIGDVVLYQMLFMTAMHSVQGIVSLLPEAATLLEGVDSLRETLAHPPQPRGGRKVGEIATIEFRNVTFAYPGGAPVIENFSKRFAAGRTFAIVGPNGAGKTTLLKLAVGALEPQSGEILVNDVPMKEIDQGEFRRRIGVVFQDSLAVSATLLDNITLRDPSYTDDDAKTAAAASGFDAVAAKLPDGLGSRIGIGGQSLSGGEAQRLAIARALVRNPTLLAFDEATNHLDADARAAFGRLLRRISPGRIVLLVSHDESIADLCDDKIVCR